MIAIVIPVFNQLHYTKGCLESLWKTTPKDVQIVVVNNGSTDGTKEFLAGLSGIHVIQNENNLGCAPAWNQGVKALNADWTVVLNNDVLLTAGWLEALLDFAAKNNVGIISPAIREGELNYDLAGYACEFVSEMKNVARWGVASGICFAVQKKVFEGVGGFDENFRIGVFEDTDFFLRVKKAKFALATTGCSFIHHFGSITQKAIKKQVERPYEAENRVYFRRKWKLTAPKRFWMRLQSKTAYASFRWRERLAHGHSLNERWIEGKLHFF